MIVRLDSTHHHASFLVFLDSYSDWPSEAHTSPSYLVVVGSRIIRTTRGLVF